MASAPPTATKQAAIIANPAKVDIAALRRAVTAAEQEFGWPESICLETTEDDPGVGQTAEALDRGASLIVAAGGDGTVRVVAEALQGSSARLGLIPAGTGNLLARNLGIDVNSVTHALAIAFGDSERKIDLGIADVERPDGSREHTVFTVLCGVGIDAAMIANTDDDLKRRVGWVAYVDGIRRSLKGGSTMRFRCRTDQGPTISVHANTIMVGNCGLLPGNVVLMPDAVIDDGELDVAILRPNGIGGWMQIWARLVAQSGLIQRTEVGKRWLVDGRRMRALDYSRAREFVIRLDSEPAEFEVDGDAFGEMRAARIHLEAGGLTVKAPEQSRTATAAIDAAVSKLQRMIGQVNSVSLPGFGTISMTGGSRDAAVECETEEAAATGDASTDAAPASIFDQLQREHGTEIHVDKHHGDHVDEATPTDETPTH